MAAASIRIGYSKEFEYSKDTLSPPSNGSPSFTRQSLNVSRLNTCGLISLAEANHPQATCMFLTAQSTGHKFII